MPEIDGFSAMGALKEINPAVKLIASSGLGAKDKVNAAEAIGLQAF